MQQKNRSVTARKFPQCARQRDAVDQAGEAIVFGSVLAAYLAAITFAVRLVERNLSQSFPAKVHEHCVDRNAVKPRRKGGVSAEGHNLAKNLQERLLSKILRFRDIVGHPQTYRVDARLVRVKQSGKRLRVPLLGALDQVRIEKNRTCYQSRCSPESPFMP